MPKISELIEQIKSEVNKLGISPKNKIKSLGLLKELEALTKEKKEDASTQLSFEKTGEIQIWSDGACSGNPGPGGWGTIVQMDGEKHELSGFSSKTTNNIMEMTGALKGLEIAPEGASVTLTTDSQYLIKGATQWMKGWKKKNWKKADGSQVLNQDLWKKIDEQIASKKVEWKWVKGHAGHPENERCDFLATNEIRKNS